jgi:hypothetical protein
MAAQISHARHVRQMNNAAASARRSSGQNQQQNQSSPLVIPPAHMEYYVDEDEEQTEEVFEPATEENNQISAVWLGLEGEGVDQQLDCFVASNFGSLEAMDGGNSSMSPQTMTPPTLDGDPSLSPPTLIGPRPRVAFGSLLDQTVDGESLNFLGSGDDLSSSSSSPSILVFDDVIADMIAGKPSTSSIEKPKTPNLQSGHHKPSSSSSSLDLVPDGITNQLTNDTNLHATFEASATFEADTTFKTSATFETGTTFEAGTTLRTGSTFDADVAKVTDAIYGATVGGVARQVPSVVCMDDVLTMLQQRGYLNSNSKWQQ